MKLLTTRLSSPLVFSCAEVYGQAVTTQLYQSNDMCDFCVADVCLCLMNIQRHKRATQGTTIPHVVSSPVTKCSSPVVTVVKQCNRSQVSDGLRKCFVPICPHLTSKPAVSRQ
jgi:hypothetical protein